MPTSVNIPGLGKVNFPDDMAPEDIQLEAEKLYQQSQHSAEAGQQQSISMTKEARPEGFWGTMAHEAGAGLEQVREAVQPGANPLGAAFGAAAGGLRMAASPLTGAGRAIGETVQDATQPYIGNFASSALATGADIGTQLLAGPAALNAASKGIAGIGRLAGKMLPSAGVALRKHGIEIAEELPGMVKPMTQSDILFDQVKQFNPKIPLQPLKDKAAMLLQDESMLLSESASPLTSTAKKLIDDLAGAGPEADFQQVWTTMKGINKLIGAAKRQGGPEHGALMQLKRGLAESLDNAADPAAGKAYGVLKEANKAFRQEVASEALEDIIQKNINPREGMEAFNITAGRAMKALSEAVRKDPFLKDSFPPGSLDRINKTLDEIRKLPVIGAPTGADAGSKMMLRRSIVGGSVGELSAQAMGMPPGVGAAMGTFGSIVVSDLVSKAIQTPKGSQMLIKLVKNRGGLDQEAVRALIGFTRAQSEVRDRIKSALKDKDVPLEEKIQASMMQ